MAIEDVSSINIGGLTALIQFNVNAEDTVTSVIVTNQMTVEVEVLTPSGVNVVSRALYPPGSFTTNIPRSRQFKYSTYDWWTTMNTRQ